MKMLTRIVVILVIIFVLGGLLGLIMAKHNINLANIRAAQLIITFFAISVLIYVFTAIFRTFFKINKNLDKIMDEYLSIALDFEDSPLSAKVCASLLRFDKNKSATPCFLGITNTRLLMVVTNFMFIPIHIFSFSLNEIKSFKLSKSLMPNQYVLAWHYDEICIKIRLSLHVNSLVNQEPNALLLINELQKYS